MKKVIRLTESELSRIIKRVINEAEEPANDMGNNKTISCAERLKSDIPSFRANNVAYGNIKAENGGFSLYRGSEFFCKIK
jgi:hypothetical protein